MRISPSGEKHRRRKNDLMVSSWNMRKDLGFVSEVPSEFLGGGRDILDTLQIQFLVDILNILQDLLRKSWSYDLVQSFLTAAPYKILDAIPRESLAGWRSETDWPGTRFVGMEIKNGKNHSGVTTHSKKYNNTLYLKFSLH